LAVALGLAWGLFSFPKFESNTPTE
jgi:hypothetical protein